MLAVQPARESFQLDIEVLCECAARPTDHGRLLMCCPMPKNFLENKLQIRLCRICLGHQTILSRQINLRCVCRLKSYSLRRVASAMANAMETTKMTGSLENVLRNHNLWCCVCHGLLAGFKLAIGSLAEATAYVAITANHALGARDEFRRKPPPGQ
ncbi:MAG: hypothetical protein INF81_04720 [Roseomonas sp.]|nr:hypothetical protein [Roseomonas sp.]MCA3431314.1 hypothetical protein [Roseomonas sp.]MCA3434928.1 hypothetical protein [Roseomonas sp.]